MKFYDIWKVRNASVTSVPLAHPCSNPLSLEHELLIGAESWVIEYRQMRHVTKYCAISLIIHSVHLNA